MRIEAASVEKRKWNDVRVVKPPLYSRIRNYCHGREHIRPEFVQESADEKSSGEAGYSATDERGPERYAHDQVREIYFAQRIGRDSFRGSPSPSCFHKYLVSRRPGE